VGILHRLPPPQEDTRPTSPSRLGPAIGALGAVAVLAAAGVWQLQPSDPAAPVEPAEQSVPRSSCSWSEHHLVRQAPGNYTFRAMCEGAGVLQASIIDGDRLTGQVGNLPLTLTLDPASDAAMFDTTWVGSLGQVPVTLVVQGFAVVAGSRVGDGELRCPAPPVMSGDWTWLADDPAVVDVAFAGDPRVSADQAGALCNLMTIGLPASSYGFAKGELEPPQAG
jgi:hypothetical protein